MPFVSKQELERIKHEAAMYALLQAYLKGLSRTRRDWENHSVDIVDITNAMGHLARAAVEDSSWQDCLATIQRDYGVRYGSFGPVIEHGFETRSPIPLKLKIRLWLGGTFVTKVTADPSSLRFYEYERQILAVIDGRITRGDTASYAAALELMRPYTGNAKAGSVPLTTSTIIATMCSNGVWGYGMK